ncbi:replicative DNA helicase [Orientia tsutsugamushi str. Gilliam]|uniref:Replicative DNA helicase n=1 Tax=Orientia tsutsugamushi str. Gilliam TaxID=1359184 RepID=A0A0F3MD05_ORITS|nr:replicative DNA helicase [Orientia tsutsugamushi]KJV52454.1 replicative DNA helicase [Orientia tsutsugamushi str. Gilliam]SPR06830.1 replicative DNA helicase [Orientia tsutsugamushi str. Gilliam]
MEKDLAKIAPSNIQAEQMILGAILINNRTLYNINEFLLPEHFYEPLHGKIYKSINLIISKGISATVISLKNMLGNEPSFEEIGRVDYLAKLTTLALSIVNANEYGKIVYDLALRRYLIEIAEKIATNAYSSTLADTAISQIETAESQLYDLASRGTLSKGFIKLQTSIEESWTSISSAIKNKNSINGISSGLLDLDSKLGGFKNSDLIILAGRPSMGKTALGVNLAVNACKYFLSSSTQQNSKVSNITPSVGFFSLEMSSQQISTRILSIESEINSSALFNGKIDEQDVDKLKTVQDEIQKWNFFIDDAPAISISAIRSRARRLKRTHNLAILFVDYLQLIKIDNRRSQYNRVQEISEITQSLKALAKDLNISIIALSQLSRAVEQRSDKKPLLSDLRESGSIEQDADIVMLIYRDEYYLSRSEPNPGTPEYTEWVTKQNKCYNTAEIIVAKHRNGPVGTVKLHYNSRYSKFGNIVKNSHQS